MNTSEGEAMLRAPKVRTSHHRNKEEAARLQKLVDERYASRSPPAGTQDREAMKGVADYLETLIKRSQA